MSVLGVLFSEVPDIPKPWTDPIGLLYSQHAAAGLNIGPRTAMPLWGGERLDVGWAIDVLHPRAIGE